MFSFFIPLRSSNEDVDFKEEKGLEVPALPHKIPSNSGKIVRQPGDHVERHWKKNC